MRWRRGSDALNGVMARYDNVKHPAPKSSEPGELVYGAALPRMMGGCDGAALGTAGHHTKDTGSHRRNHEHLRVKMS